MSYDASKASPEPVGTMISVRLREMVELQQGSLVEHFLSTYLSYYSFLNDNFQI